MSNEPLIQLLGTGGVLATIVGLVVWIVKQSFKRQGDITDRYFQHLEETHKVSAKTSESLTGAFSELSGTMRNLDERTTANSTLIKELTNEVIATRKELTGACRHPEVKHG